MAGKRIPRRGPRWCAALAVPVLGALTAGLLSTVSTASAATLVSEDFESGPPSGWSKSGGDWDVVSDGDSQVFQQAKLGSELARQFGGDSDWSDYRAAVRVKPREFDGSGSFAALGARSTSATKMYRLALYPDRAELQAVSGGRTDVIGSLPMSVDTGTWYTLDITAEGDRISASVDGQSVASADDGTWIRGRMALATSYATAAFDDVVVTDDGVPPTDPTDPPTDPTDPPTDPPGGDALYAAPDGTADASGTESDPTTLASAISRVSSGGAVYLRGGTYRYSETVTIEPGDDGSSGDRTLLAAYPGETPVLDFSAQSEDSANRGLRVNGSYWHVRGITVEHAGDNGIFVGGSGNIIEGTVTRFNRDTGLQVSRISSDTPRSEWPSDNLIVSAVSHDNVDSDGEDADGFAPKLTTGPGNVFRHTVSHNNIDDGYDLYTKSETGAIGAVTIEDSLAYENGTLSDGSQAGDGDRNGYKLGGEDIGVDHVVSGNIAYDNGKHGFTYNRNTGSMAVSDNVGIGSEERNFNFDGGSSVFRGNTSCDSGSNDRTIGDADGSNQFWSGSNGSRCADYSGELDWSFDSEGRLVVTFGGRRVDP
ncbi:right-handed parallel beta-helix repeat-containing protein [Streptomonospora wellingtoniae]|uniref:Right-handed parallel beta-helix repeat-containing protein n=1 Tax=Streptomonospora wellingtoniae TaxID=3075544 RepID=A0ABU2KQ95_9ACTN|nr:right-handed parallel beta-helix repeat-containing protein [Streptomonospora sp. DSM 45055]MDT0301342.1 right-handed parallel beta-helix repeat-containing protein [Streptomonospora sp. DSM 45055]